MTSTMGNQERDIVTVRLDGFDGHGTTTAALGRRRVAVEQGIPGELARVEVFGTRRLRGSIVEVVEPSRDRIAPPCPYFRDWKCGGCQWQQIAYPAQLRYKQQQAIAALQDEGLEHALDATHSLEDPWRYRHTATIALGKSAGFRRHGSLAIVPIRDCPISHPLIGKLMSDLNDLLTASSLPDYRGRMVLEVRVVVEGSEDRLQVLVRSSDPRERSSDQDASILTSALVRLAYVCSLSALRMDGSTEQMKGEIFPTVLVDGRASHVGPSSFVQTNLSLLPKLMSRLREEAHPLAGKRVADVYAGAGVFGLDLAEDSREVALIETGADALEAARHTAQERGLDNVRFLHTSAEEALARDARYDVIIVDPPRPGLSAAVLETLLAAQASLILYVSCFAPSLAGDLRVLSEGPYALTSLELFDFYPQTYHMEMLAVLRPDVSGRPNLEAGHGAE